MHRPTFTCTISDLVLSCAGMGGNRTAVSNAQLASLREQVQQTNNGVIPHNFVRTASGHDPSSPNPRGRMPQSSPRNPQTEQFLDMLGLTYNLDQQAYLKPAVAPAGLGAELLGCLCGILDFWLYPFAACKYFTVLPLNLHHSCLHILGIDHFTKRNVAVLFRTCCRNSHL